MKVISFVPGPASTPTDSNSVVILNDDPAVNHLVRLAIPDDVVGVEVIVERDSVGAVAAVERRTGLRLQDAVAAGEEVVAIVAEGFDRSAFTPLRTITLSLPVPPLMMMRLGGEYVTVLRPEESGCA